MKLPPEKAGNFLGRYKRQRYNGVVDGWFITTRQNTPVIVKADQ